MDFSQDCEYKSMQHVNYLFQAKKTNGKKIDHVTGIRGWKKMIGSFAYRKDNVRPIEEWLCYVDTFFSLTQELDVDELDKNLVELKEWCELYTHPKTTFFELLYEKFTEHRSHPNLKELMLELIRTRDEERLLRKEVLYLDYFRRVKAGGVGGETEQVGTDKAETSKDDYVSNDDANKEKQIGNNHAELLPKEMTDYTITKSCSRKSISGETDDDNASGILDTGKASNCHGNRKNVAENEQSSDTDYLNFGAKNMRSDEHPKSGGMEQNTMCNTENDNTIDASVSWINVAKDDIHHEEKTVDKHLGAGQEAVESAKMFDEDSEDEDGFVQIEYKDLE